MYRFAAAGNGPNDNPTARNRGLLVTVAKGSSIGRIAGPRSTTVGAMPEKTSAPHTEFQSSVVTHNSQSKSNRRRRAQVAVTRPREVKTTGATTLVRNSHIAADPLRKIKVLLVDDHKIFREGLASLLRRESDVEVVGEADNGRVAIDLARKIRPDVVVMDINMPVINGIQATKVITHDCPGVRVIGLSIFEDDNSTAAILAAGAARYVSKSDAPAKVLGAIRGSTFPSETKRRRSARSSSSRRYLRGSAPGHFPECDARSIDENRVGIVKSPDERVDKRVGATMPPRSARHRLKLLKKERPAELEETIRELRVEQARRKYFEDALKKTERRLHLVMDVGSRKVGRKVVEDALRRSEERFRLLVEVVKDYAIYMLDPDGYILSWNQGAERIKGYTAEEAIGSHFSVFYPLGDIRSQKPARDLATAASEGRFEDEGWRIRKDGSRFWANIVITALRDAEGRLRGFSKVTRDITERKRTEESLRKLSGRLLTLQDEERRRLARELHDSTAQTLSALCLNLALVRLQADVTTSPKAEKALSDALELADHASQEIRAISYLLHPPLLDEQGLGGALRWYVDGYIKRTKINVDLEISPPELERLSSELETALFRIVQECLTNIYRHSGSPTAEVRLTWSSDVLSLRVRDHGKGLSEERLKGNDDTPVAFGVGIYGMRERVRQLGGHMEIVSGNPGTIVEVSLPLTPGSSSIARLPEHSREPAPS